MLAFAIRRPLQSVLLVGALLVFAGAFAVRGQAGQAQLGLAQNTVCPAPQPIPAGFDYPQTGATVMGWVSSNNTPRTRQHGWNLWAALNTVGTGGKPIWQTWCTETQAFAPALAPGKLGATAQPAVASVPLRQFKLKKGVLTAADPINFPTAPAYAVPAAVIANPAYKACLLYDRTGKKVTGLNNGPTLQNNGDVMIAGVIYNQPAFDWIRKPGSPQQPLYLQSTLNSMVPKAGTAQISSFPSGSIALKPMMWPVAKGGFTALPVWGGPTQDGGVYAGFEQQKMWPNAVAVTTTPQAQIVPTSVTMPMAGVTWVDNTTGKTLGPVGALTYQKPRVVGTNSFYNYVPNLATAAACDRAIMDASAWYAYGRSFQQGDALVLIAMHIMTKEQPDWTFQSVWWNDMPGTGNPYAADRPALSPSQAPGPWRNYLMASTYGIPASPGYWPVAFNPYIELAADHPIQTNCMNCHKRAAWPADGAEYLEPNGPTALQIFGLDNSVLAKKVQVDSLWSVSDRALSNAQDAEAVAQR